MNIKDKSAIVTGGAKGIGKSLVEKLVNEGVNVGVFDIDTEALNRIRENNPRIYCKACDVSDNAQVEESVEEFYGKFKAIDILVNNAGMVDDALLISFSEGKIKKHDVNIWDKVIATNLSSVFYMTSCVVEKMVLDRTKGVIVNVSSISAGGNAGQTAYAAAKAGVRALTVTWADELSPFGIRVAGIAPGFSQTTLIQSMKQNILDHWIKKVPLKRLARLDEIADGILFIIRNDFYNGKILELDGGLRM